MRVCTTIRSSLNVRIENLEGAETRLLSAQKLIVACEGGFPASVDTGNNYYSFNGADPSKKSAFWIERPRTSSRRICASPPSDCLASTRELPMFYAE